MDFQKKLIDTITTKNFYSKLKESNENDMAAQVFWALFIPADGRAKSTQLLLSKVLPFDHSTPYIFHESKYQILFIYNDFGRSSTGTPAPDELVKFHFINRKDEKPSGELRTS